MVWLRDREMEWKVTMQSCAKWDGIYPPGPDKATGSACRTGLLQACAQSIRRGGGIRQRSCRPDGLRLPDGLLLTDG